MTEPAEKLPDHIAESVAAVEELHARHLEDSTGFEQLAERAARLLGQPVSLAVLTIVVCGWLMATGFRSAAVNGLELALSVFAVYVTLLILAGQRRQERLANMREQLTLQLALVNERETAKTISLLEELRRDSPALANRQDPEADAMAAKVDAKQMTEAIVQAETK